MARPVLACCIPHAPNTPSGRRTWCHAWTCPFSPGRTVTQQDRELAAAFNVHPARGVLRAADDWGAHPDGCGCDSCGYTDAHLDDDDDTDRRGQYADQ